MDKKIIDAHQDSIYHSEHLKKQKTCGCFYCLEIFSVHDIEEWTDEGTTALCPHCGIDAVIAETPERPLTLSFLQQMHDQWF